MAASAMEKVLEWTLQYTEEHKACGKPIVSFQNRRFILAELATESTVVRMMVDEFIRLHHREEVNGLARGRRHFGSARRQAGQATFHRQ